MDQIGQMRERVVIQAPTDTVDGIGSVSTTWATVSTVWARVQPADARERIVGDRLAAKGEYEVTIRYLTGLTPSHKLTWRSRDLMISRILNTDEQRRFLTLLCTDPAPDGGAT
jgi:SPP1 family predicted phage head-tail adaptor